MIIHPFGEYPDFHSQLHEPVAAGLVMCDGWTHLLAEACTQP